MESLVFFGKGGIGKSTIASNLAAAYALAGKRVLLVGCDPKHDSSRALAPDGYVRTFMEGLLEGGARPDARSAPVKGRFNVHLMEAGGPEPGVGCAGRGITLMLETFKETRLLEKGDYDVVIFDILGDVVCGGFATPLRQGFGKKIFIVASEELMSLYAANNIAKAVRHYSPNGVVLGGLVANLRDPKADRAPLERFASLIGTRILTFIPRDKAVHEAEYRRKTVVEHAPASPFVKTLAQLSSRILALQPGRIGVPTPLEDREFYRLSMSEFAGTAPARRPPRVRRTA
ncbi:MAG: AAA family ATPase [Elusimicrobia bacterium]|nr:AAA family ATPase [Elusimicrobiota bacterium]